MNYQIDPTNRPAYLQLYRLLRDDIIAGVLPYGSRLPSKRLLAEETGVSTVTVEHAYALLCEEGYAAARERSGFFVLFRSADGFAAPAPAYSPPPRPADAEMPLPFPATTLARAMRKVLAERPDALGKKPPNPGCTELRRAIQGYLARNRGIRAALDQIVVGSGAEALYRLIIELLGRSRTYAIESPSYEKLEQLYRVAGCGLELLPLAADGIDSGALAASCADVLHTTPYRSFPSGVTATASKRHEYIRWAAQPGRVIIESDYGSEFSVASQPMEALYVLSDRENVIYLNTFSRTISPALRAGYMVLPPPLAAAFREKLGFLSCTVPTFDQLVLAELLTSGAFERQINRARRAARRGLE